MYPPVVNVPRKDETHSDEDNRRQITRIKFDMGKLEGEDDLYWARFYTSNGWTICEKHGYTHSAIMEFISDVTETIRDVGFEHGREYVRKALGIK